MKFGEGGYNGQVVETDTGSIIFINELFSLHNPLHQVISGADGSGNSCQFLLVKIHRHTCNILRICRNGHQGSNRVFATAHRKKMQ